MQDRIPQKSTADRLQLVRLSASGPLPCKRGWYRIGFEPGTAAAGRQLLLDLGVGFNRHHSVSLPDGDGASFVRVPRPVRAIALATGAAELAPVIHFTPLSRMRGTAEWLADIMAVALARAFHPLRRASRRPVVRWGMKGLKLVPAHEGRFPAKSSYQLWRERYPRNCLQISPLAGLVQVRTENAGHRQLNQLLQRSNVQWIAIIRNEATVQPDAFVYLLHIARAAGASVVYADSDRLDARGNHFDPVFRTAFSPERLLSEDWLGPLLLVEAAMARRVGGWRESAGEALHYDLCLRILNEEGAAAFAHASAILCSETARARSVPTDSDRVRAAAIDAAGLPAPAFGFPGALLPANIAAQCTVIIPTRDRLDLLRPAVESLFRVSKTPPGEVIIVDNGSTQPETLAWLRHAAEQYPGFRVLRDSGSFNFSRLCNGAARAAKGRILAFLNNDTMICSPTWLELCGAVALRPGIGCVGPLLTYADGRIQHAGLVTGPGGIAGHVWSGQRPELYGMQAAPLVTRNVTGLTGACLIVTKEAFDSVGGFDEQHLGVAFNDLDLCLRMSECGLRHVLLPWCRVVHEESRSRARDDYESSDGRFRSEYDWMRKRWGKVLDNDRFFPAPLRIDNMTPALFWRSHSLPGDIQ